MTTTKETEVRNLLRTSLQRTKQFARHCLSWRPYSQLHYSQEGEDLLLQRVFQGQQNGFYVDVGAHHPQRFSNTYWAYQLGWSGLNIDAAPGFTKQFNKSRPRDISVERCIAETAGPVDFFVFPEAALNTTSLNRSSQVHGWTGETAKIVTVQGETLGKLLHEHVPKNVATIDFMSIDIEGREMAALRSNDWDAFKPRVLILEALGRTLLDLDSSPEVQFVQSMGFTPVAMLYHSVVFVSDKSLLDYHWSAEQRIEE